MATCGSNKKPLTHIRANASRLLLNCSVISNKRTERNARKNNK